MLLVEGDNGEPGKTGKLKAKSDKVAPLLQVSRSFISLMCDVTFQVWVVVGQRENTGRCTEAFPKPVSHGVFILSELCVEQILRTAGIGVTEAPNAEVKRGQWEREKSEERKV